MIDIECCFCKREMSSTIQSTFECYYCSFYSKYNEKYSKYYLQFDDNRNILCYSVQMNNLLLTASKNLKEYPKIYVMLQDVKIHDIYSNESIISIDDYFIDLKYPIKEFAEKTIKKLLNLKSYT